MLRISFLLVSILSVVSCSSVRVIDSERASKLNADLGVAYMMKGSYEQSLAKFKKAIRLNPDNGRAYLYTAELYRRLNEDARAIEYYEQAIDVAPEDAAINNNYGAYLCGKKKYDEAFRYLKLALLNPVYPDRAEVYENIGVCYEAQGNIKMARENFIKAISLKPYLSNSLLAVAKLDFDDNKIISAKKYITYFNKAAKDTSESIWLNILIARKIGNRKTVESFSWSLANKFPKSKEAKLLKRLRASGEF